MYFTTHLIMTEPRSKRRVLPLVFIVKSYEILTYKLFSKIKKKQERDAALHENTKLMNCVAKESRELNSIQMKLKRFQIIIKVTDFYFTY